MITTLIPETTIHKQTSIKHTMAHCQFQPLHCFPYNILTCYINNYSSVYRWIGSSSLHKCFPWLLHIIWKIYFDYLTSTWPKSMPIACIRYCQVINNKLLCKCLRRTQSNRILEDIRSKRRKRHTKTMSLLLLVKRDVWIRFDK